MENNACWEHIADGLTFRCHIFDIYDFWGHEARSSTSNEQVLAFIGICGESKVTDSKLETILPFEHYILGFEIAMNYSLFSKMV